MKKFSILVALLGLAFSLNSYATLMELTLSGQVSANGSHPPACPTSPLISGCQYFPIGDTISLSLVYDDQSGLSYSPTAGSAYYDNAFKSISFSSSHVSYSGTFTGNFGQFIVKNSTRDGLTFRLWELPQNQFASATANPMDLPSLDTTVANPADDVHGHIEIATILINLTSLNTSLFSSLSIPASFSMSDFDDANNTNWSFVAKNAGGWSQSIGVNMTGLSLRVANSGQENTDPAGNGSVPVPMTLALVLSGLALIARQRRPR